MKVFSIAKGFHFAWKHNPPELTQKELDKLRAITIYKETHNVRLILCTFGISRATLYRWLKGFDPKDLNTLKYKTTRPRRLRSPL